MSNPDFSKSKIPPYEFPSKLVDDHPELHHYTDRKGLTGIWQSNSLWATHFSNLTDSLEIKVLRKPLADLLTNEYRKFVVQQMIQSLKYRRKVNKSGGSLAFARRKSEKFVYSNYDIAFLNKEGGMAEPFLTSFCSHSNDNKYEQAHGLLSQWRGYEPDLKLVDRPRGA